MSNALIGNKISLISKNLIRYTGILYTVNQEELSVALKDVTSHGTEGRYLELDPPQPDRELPANFDKVHEYLLFKGSDIKDLHVHDSKTDDKKPTSDSTNAESSTLKGGELPPPPPQVTTTKEKKPKDMYDDFQGKKEQSELYQSRNTRQIDDETFGAGSSSRNNNNDDRRRNNNDNRRNNNNNRRTDDRDRRDGGERRSNNNNRRENNNQSRRSNNNRNDNNDNNDSSNVREVGTGKSLLNRKARTNGPNGNLEAPVIATGTDYDFEENTLENDTNNNSDDEEEIKTNTYNKDNFFDDLSNNVQDKELGINGRVKGSKERESNMEAFGAVSLGGSQNRRGGRGGGRGGYRGGRGGGDRRREGGHSRNYRGNNRYSDSDGMPGRKVEAEK